MNSDKTGNLMIKWARDIYPFCRSIMGPEFRKSLLYFKKIHKDMNIISFKSGSKVFDWIIPDEWQIKDAYIEDKNGNRYAEFKKHNLHIVNYSIPINKIMDRSKLLPHIHSLPKQPNSIPYVTSYYKKDWGFCIEENIRKKLPKGKYKVLINSNFKKGELNIGEVYLRGKSKKEIFFSTYLCHPSMVNNELSGPVLSSALIKFIKDNFTNKKYSYRFVFLPETIGSISYLSKKYKKLKANMIAGYVLSCVGDERAFSHIESRNSDSLADLSLEASFIGRKKTKKYSYIHRGSDERQYCAPGIDLPVAGFSKSKYGEYPEYHTNKDDFNLVTKKGLIESYEIIKTIIKSFETSLKPKYTVLCEPQLGKKGLYPNLSSKRSKIPNLRLDLLSYADGNKNIFEIAKKINVPLDAVLEEILILKKYKLIK